MAVLFLGFDLSQKGFAGVVRDAGSIGRARERTTAFVADSPLLLQRCRIRYSDVLRHLILPVSLAHVSIASRSQIRPAAIVPTGFGEGSFRVGTR